MKTHFKIILTEALITALLLNVNFNACAQWSTNGTTNDAYNSNSSGRVGIGTTTPQTNTKLEIVNQGGSRGNGISDFNTMLKLSNYWNGTLGALNEPTIIFDN